MKLILIQNELKAPKDLNNSFGGYKYRSCESILEALKPLLQKHSCSLVISDDIVCVGDRVYVKATAKLSDCEGDKSWEVNAFAREALSKKGMDEAQVTGAASSYARKYALNGLFAIDDTKDADTRDNTNEGKPAPKKTAQQKIAEALEADPEAKWFEVPFPSSKEPHKGKSLGDVAGEGDTKALQAVLMFIDPCILDHELAKKRLESAIVESKDFAERKDESLSSKENFDTLQTQGS